MAQYQPRVLKIIFEEPTHGEKMEVDNENHTKKKLSNYSKCERRSREIIEKKAPPLNTQSLSFTIQNDANIGSRSPKLLKAMPCDTNNATINESVTAYSHRATGVKRTKTHHAAAFPRQSLLKLHKANDHKNTKAYATRKPLLSRSHCNRSARGRNAQEVSIANFS